MTIINRVKSLVDSELDLGSEYDAASVEKMIYMAYYIGLEEGTHKTPTCWLNSGNGRGSAVIAKWQ